MASSLEARSPFLDHNFAEFVCALPEHLRLRGNIGKYLLKVGLRGRLPATILRRPKKGFGIPVAKLILGGLREQVIAEFQPDKLRQEGFFNPDYVQKLLTNHLAGRQDNRKLLWTLLMFQLWYKNYLSP
jgi:asparagine synthase (glutamine-hydrolysing)